MILAKHNFLATFFNIEISELVARLLMEIEEDFNPGVEERQFLEIALEKRKNSLCRLVVCHSRSF